MPCKNISEYIKITLNKDECIEHYEYGKASCNRPIGDSSYLLNILKNNSAESIAQKNISEYFHQNHTFSSETEEFLFVKHIQAIQNALLLYLGAESTIENFEIDSIDYSDTSIVISVLITSEVDTKTIKPCKKGCKGC